MPPKQKESAISLFQRAFDKLEDHYFDDAERILDRADDLGYTADPLVQSARAYWCYTKFRTEEGFALATAALAGLPSPVAANPATAPQLAYLLAASALEGFQDYTGPAKVYEGLLQKEPTDRFVSEKLVHAYAVSRNFKGMQKQSQELTKSFKGEPRLPLLTVMALLLQVEKRRTMSVEQAADCLQYKLAQRIMETAVITEANSPAPPGAAPAAATGAAAAAAANSNKGGGGGGGGGSSKKNKQKQQQPQEEAAAAAANKEEDKKKYFLSPSVVQIYVDVLRAQKKYDELVAFLLTTEKGKLFGSWTERVFESAKVLRLAGKTAEANSIARHLWSKVDPDRYEWFEFYRDTCCGPVASFAAGSAAKGETKLECGPGVANAAEALLQDVLAVDEDLRKRKSKLRTPRLAAISLLTDHVNAEGKRIAAAKKDAALRSRLIAEHVAAMPAKPLLFFDLVKFVGPADADTIEKAGSPVLAQGYCRRAELEADDSKTAAFVKMCLGKWAPGKKKKKKQEEQQQEQEQAQQPDDEEKAEADAVASDIFIVAACSACIRRAMMLKSSSSSSSLLWMNKAAAVADHAIERFAPHVPHITMLSLLLHSAVANGTAGALAGDTASCLKELRLKSMQVESAPFALHVALREAQDEAALDLLQHGARYHRGLRYDESTLAGSCLRANAALPALEDLFENTRLLVRSVARAEHFAFSALMVKCVKESDTGPLLRQALLGARAELRREVIDVSFDLECSRLLLDKKQLFSVMLHEDPTSATFDAAVNFLLDGASDLSNAGRAQQLRAAKLVAAALLTLDHATAESCTPKSKQRMLTPQPLPQEEIERLLSEEKDDEERALWQWVSALGKAASEVLGKEKLDKRAATDAVVKLIGTFKEVVARGAERRRMESFLFPVLQLIVVSTRVLCDRQPQGVKAAVVELRTALEKVEENLAAAAAAASVVDDESKSSDELFSLGDFEAHHNAACKQQAAQMKQRRLARVSGAIAALVTVEKLTK